jgi:hypothetical protein
MLALGFFSTEQIKSHAHIEATTDVKIPESATVQSIRTMSENVAAIESIVRDIKASMEVELELVTKAQQLKQLVKAQGIRVSSLTSTMPTNLTSNNNKRKAA